MTAVRRALSPMERWYWILDQISPLDVIARVRVDGALDESSLRAGADALAKRHPLLRVTVVENGKSGPGFEPTDAALPVRSITGAAETWAEEVDTVELARSSAPGAPLARVLRVAHGNSHDVVLVVSHIVADGTSALSMLRDLVEYAATAQQGAPVVVEPLHTVDAPETRFPSRYQGTLGVARAVCTALAGQVRMLAARPRRLPAQAQVEPTQRRTRLLRRELDTPEVERLVETCRAAGVSVHGALCGALAQAIGEEIGEGGAGKLTIGSPVDFRGELEPPVRPDEAGAYVCTLPTVVRYAPEPDIWSAAAQTNRDLRERTSAGQHFALVAMLAAITPKTPADSAGAMKTAERRGPGNICLSNIGRYDFPTRAGEWTLSGAQFIAGISMSGYYVGTVNTSHGKLFWNFTYIDGIVSAERATTIADRTLELLRAAITSTREPAASRTPG
ncbi:phthiocerol/phthiodiolone dimycocerosyl transferase family protein [Nocardia shimofusensis]|uniref:phthiocerol/phthiodiolone dimycocerosyl transferase family protein n=1 Tax=Nocardia shimofusensis TaxID=228596 RepID=UPI00082FC4DC|nr:hypothetical protein [Nocardia shimofusensis]